MRLTYTNLTTGQRVTTEAIITTDHAASSYGHPVVILPDGDVIDLTTWTLLSYQVVSASDDEVALLRRFLRAAPPPPVSAPADDLIGLAEAARISGLTASHLARLAAAGDIPARKVGRNWVISRSDAAAIPRQRASGGGRKPA